MDWTPVWEPTILPPRAPVERAAPVCVDCGAPVSTKNSTPPERCRSCASRARNLARYGPREARSCPCGVQLSPTTRRTALLCRVCSAREREAVKPNRERVKVAKVKPAIDVIRGTAMPGYTTSPRPSHFKNAPFELVACGANGDTRRSVYNVYVGVDLAGRVEKCEGGWRVRGGDGSVHPRAVDAAKGLTPDNR